MRSKIVSGLRRQLSSKASVDASIYCIKTRKWYYSKPGAGRRHCHLKKGKPTYVALWEEDRGEVRLVEVTYVGTHEDAPY